MLDISTILNKGFDNMRDSSIFRGSLISILEDIGDKKISCKAYRHKLGFICIEPEQNNLHLNLNKAMRYHIWDNNSFFEDDYHNHRYNFMSYVLCGSIINEIVHLSKKNNGSFDHSIIEYQT